MDTKRRVTSYSDAKTKYTYSSEDNSILDCAFILPASRFLAEKMPFWLPANYITIFSNLVVLLATVIAFNAHKTSLPIWVFIPVLFIIYLIGDSIDGLQARRTKTGSKLGEFIDHFLDCFVTGELIFCVFISYNITSPLLIVCGLFVTYLVQIVSFWEKYITGKMYFGKISSTESVIVLSFFAAVGYIPQVHRLLTMPLELKLPFTTLSNIYLAKIFITLAALGALVSAMTTILRVKVIHFSFSLYFIFAFFLSIVLTLFTPYNFVLSYFILMIYHVAYGTALLRAIILKKNSPYPDFILPLAAIVALLLGKTDKSILIVFLCYISIVTMFQAWLFIKDHLQYWYWVNPKLPNDEA